MTLTHAEKIRQAGIRKYGSEESWIQAQKEFGSMGGKKSVAKGFAKNKELASKAGTIGGKLSKPGTRK